MTGKKKVSNSHAGDGKAKNKTIRDLFKSAIEKPITAKNVLEVGTSSKRVIAADAAHICDVSYTSHAEKVGHSLGLHLPRHHRHEWLNGARGATLLPQVARKRQEAESARQDDAKKAKQRRSGKRRKHQPEDIEPCGAGRPDMTRGDSDGDHPLHASEGCDHARCRVLNGC